MLLNLETEHYFALNEVGAQIVAHLTQQPMEEAIDALLARYEVEPDVLRRDIQNLVDALMQAGLLQRVRSVA